MGTDCKLRIDNQYYRMDRWYVFDQYPWKSFESGKKYTRQEALNLLGTIKKRKHNDYCEHWIKFAMDRIKDNKNCQEVAIINEHDIEYIME